MTVGLSAGNSHENAPGRPWTPMGMSMKKSNLDHDQGEALIINLIGIHRDDELF